jgi:dienelactone hydrolase
VIANVVVFHHAQGLTQGVRRFAEELRAAGHQVVVPDLYEGATFDTLEAGVAFAEEIGFARIVERGSAAVEDLPNDVVYAGFSLGVMPAQMLAQTRPGARGALLFHACIPVRQFGSWPNGLAVQVHAMQDDALFVEDGDLAAARDLVADAQRAELFLYPGDRHLFADSSLASYDETAARLLTRRTLDFLRS